MTFLCSERDNNSFRPQSARAQKVVAGEISNRVRALIRNCFSHFPAQHVDLRGPGGHQEGLRRRSLGHNQHRMVGNNSFLHSLLYFPSKNSLDLLDGQ